MEPEQPFSISPLEHREWAMIVGDLHEEKKACRQQFNPAVTHNASLNINPQPDAHEDSIICFVEDLKKMIINDQEAIALKSWVVKKLEDISDADSDVLADYVLALIRADTPEPELRLNAIENLEDFLKENTAAFVDAVFLAIHNKSYMPAHVALQSAPATSTSFPASSAPSDVQLQDPTRSVSFEELQQSRKRSYNDRPEDSGGGDPHYARGDRQLKQIRRGGGPRNGRMDLYGSRGGRGGFQSSGSPANIPQGPTMGFANLPMPPSGLPFDPSDPIAAMMAMQAMGLPSFPGMPPIPQPTPPSAYDGFGAQGNPLLDLSNNIKGKVRCRDYDTKGYCARGNSCSYEHGNDHLIVPGHDEYDPKNSVMIDIPKIPSISNKHGNADGQRSYPNDRGAGRGRGRGDRGGFNQTRRNRAEFSHSGPNHDRSVTTIVVEQIPEERFDENAVREFFSQFGTIEQITMQAYKRLALVKYKDYSSSRRAYDSPKVIFDNRFVKVYWYKPESTPTGPTNGLATNSSTTTASTEEQAYDKDKFERDAMAAQKKLDEKKALIRDTEAKRKALEKQKEELARRQAEEKKRLMEKLAAKGKAKGTDTGIDAETTNSNTNGTNGTDDGKVSAQTKALRAQVAALEAEAKSLGLDSVLSEDPWAPRGRGRGRGRGSYRGWEGFAGRGSAGFDSARGGSRGRAVFRGARGGGAYNLDNRTKRVGVSGVEFDAKKDEALRQYLLGIGEFEAIETHADRTNFQVISFKDRFTAEQFMYGQKDIPSVGKLEFSWVNSPLPPGRPSEKHAPTESDTEMPNASADDDNNDKAAADVDYDVAEEDDRWMVEIS